MPSQSEYLEKFEKIAPQTLFGILPEASRDFLRDQAVHWRFTLQELKQVCDIVRDLQMWGESLETAWPSTGGAGKADKKRLLAALERHWSEQKQAPNRYPHIPVGEQKKPSAEVVLKEKGKLGLGWCPVASKKTRCCNLLTLDAVDNCGYGCSYCSIQSFYSGNKVFFDPGFAEKLAAIEIDPERIYHIGTGQSSDSLMWGNSHGVLDAQLAFARRHPNVILEFKTKSANVSHLLEQELPPNLICTWSLNTPAMIANEEHGSAPLDKRLDAARRIADKGGIVGFHFHPMVHYDGWQEDYSALFERLQQQFDPARVALLSLGTLTFIKPVMKMIREKGDPSQILKMPLVEAEGKLSYPDQTKLDLFQHAYGSFNDEWRREVFFYLCMEHQRFWQPVFGFEYDSNESFEQAMKQHYLAKTRRGLSAS